MIERAFSEQLHPRGTGAQGGQFVAGGAGQQKAAPARTGARPRSKTAVTKRDPNSLSFDGKRGTGYGSKNGDKRVRALQEALNKLGLTDSAGNKLKIDGKLGPKTTAAIKKAQRQLGVKADGVVTSALLARLRSGKKLAKEKAPAKKVAAKTPAVRKPQPAKKAAPAKKTTAPARTAPRKAAPVVVNRS
jgi:peptidoglycan hydrolase-like protein with peptidoglycan-binding domain